MSRFLLRVLAAAFSCAIASVTLAAEPSKVLRIAAFEIDTLDPQQYADDPSFQVVMALFEPAYEWDYLSPTPKLSPLTAAALPEMADGGRVWTIRLRQGILFHDDPVFKGKPRELTAADHAYGIKRLIDPGVKSPWRWLVEGRIVGADEARDKATKTGKFDYDAPIAGLEVVDRYTLRIRLREPDLRFLYALAVPNTGAVAREVVEMYGLDFGGHPVGTGPYMLGEYKRSAKIVLVANPGYRHSTYVPSGPIPPEAQPVAAALKGKKLPLAGRIEANVIEEGQAQWLAFLNRELDLLERLPPDFVDEALADGKLRPNLAAKGIRLEILQRPNTRWIYFNMEDPVAGGYTPEKIALRRAISMAHDEKEFIRVLLKGRAAAAQSPIPPGIAGYDPKQKTQAQLYDPAASRALLDRFGYKDRDGDGYRETPDGKPLALEFWSTPTLISRQTDELLKKNLDAIGVRIVFKKDKLPELRKMARLGKIPMRSDGWNADYPDAENFMQLLYGPNAGQENQAQFDLPEFNKLYDDARRLPDSPQRTKLFSRMTELVVAYAPWRVTINDLEDTFAHPWARYYVPHPIRSQVWAFIDIDDAARAKAR